MMNSRETAEGFVLDYVSSYPDEHFHRECVDTLTCIIDISRAGAKAEQREKAADLADEVLLNKHPGKTMREVLLNDT